MPSLAEFGVSTNKKDVVETKKNQQYVPEQTQADYFARTILEAKRLECRGAIVWCMNDYSPKLYRRYGLDRVLHERTFGIFHADGTPKPAALALKNLGI